MHPFLGKFLEDMFHQKDEQGIRRQWVQKMEDPKEETGERNPQDDSKDDTNMIAERFILVVQLGMN